MYSIVNHKTHLINRCHKPNIVGNGIIQVGLEENIHVSIDATANEQHTISEKISLESTCK